MGCLPVNPYDFKVPMALFHMSNIPWDTSVMSARFLNEWALVIVFCHDILAGWICSFLFWQCFTCITGFTLIGRHLQASSRCISRLTAREGASFLTVMWFRGDNLAKPRILSFLWPLPSLSHLESLVHLIWVMGPIVMLTLHSEVNTKKQVFIWHNLYKNFLNPSPVSSEEMWAVTWHCVPYYHLSY